MNRTYEIGFIVNPEASEEEIKKISDSLTDTITKGGGTIDTVDEWGRKEMAYPIDKHQEGIYTFLGTSMNGDLVAEIERRLKLSEKVMRFLVVRMDDKLKRTNRLVKRWNRLDKAAQKRRSSESDRGEGRSGDGDREDDNG